VACGIVGLLLLLLLGWFVRKRLKARRNRDSVTVDHHGIAINDLLGEGAAPPPAHVHTSPPQMAQAPAAQAPQHGIPLALQPPSGNPLSPAQIQALQTLLGIEAPATPHNPPNYDQTMQATQGDPGHAVSSATAPPIHQLPAGQASSAGMATQDGSDADPWTAWVNRGAGK